MRGSRVSEATFLPSGMGIAEVLGNGFFSFEIKTCEVLGTVGNRIRLQQQALEALEKSTKMYGVALNLLKQGNKAEGERVWNEARAQRTISTLLMTQANRIEPKVRTTGNLKPDTGRLSAVDRN
jgi:hypothetical protein